MLYFVYCITSLCDPRYVTKRRFGRSLPGDEGNPHNLDRSSTTFRNPLGSQTGGAFMGIGVSLILIAAGAILAFAVHASSSTFNVQAVGAVLLVVGTIGLVASLVFWSSWGFGRDRETQTTAVERPRS
jgi:hypothetical protein